MNKWAELEDLPGATRVRRGVEARRRGEVSVDALLVAVASRRLAAAGLVVPVSDLPQDRDLALYEALRAEPGDAYARYNALRRELSSFLDAADHRLRRLAAG